MVKRTVKESDEETSVDDEIVMSTETDASESSETTEIIEIVEETFEKPAHVDRPVLKLGASGSDVAQLQARLGVKQTGVFDRNTVQAVRMFQSINALKNNGIVDNKMWDKMDQVLGR